MIWHCSESQPCFTLFNLYHKEGIGEEDRIRVKAWNEHRGKESACNARGAGDVGWIPGSGRSPGGRHGNPFQHACLGNSMDRGAWLAIVRGVTKELDVTEQVSTHTHTLTEIKGMKILCQP